MGDDIFEQIEQALRSGGPEAGFDLLARRFREEKKYVQLFESRLMKKRWELRLTLIPTEPLADLPDNARRAYEEGFAQAAREAGGLFLAEGDIERAWLYFQALGETAPVAQAIEQIQPQEGIDRIIEIAYYERVNPRKGFELILAQFGLCRAITVFPQYPERKGREECIRLLVRTVHTDLVTNLKRASTNDCSEIGPPIASYDIPDDETTRPQLLSTVFVAGAPAAEDYGNIFCTVLTTPGAPLGLMSQLVRVDARSGSVISVNFADLLPEDPTQRPALNAAPAIAPDGTIYVGSVREGDPDAGLLVSLNSDLTLNWKGRMDADAPWIARIIDISSSSPVVGPMGAYSTAATMTTMDPVAISTRSRPMISFSLPLTSAGIPRPPFIRIRMATQRTTICSRSTTCMI